MLSEEIVTLAGEVIAKARERNFRIATAESCTGGLIAGALTEVPGSSSVFECGFVTYSNEAKSSMLSVPEALIAQHGAVSEPVASAMVAGALAHSRADIAVAVTGVAGPGGGSPAKPVGHVEFGWGDKGGTILAGHQRFGDLGRSTVRERTVAHALRLLLELLNR